MCRQPCVALLRAMFWLSDNYILAVLSAVTSSVHVFSHWLDCSEAWTLDRTVTRSINGSNLVAARNGGLTLPRDGRFTNK